MHGRPIFFVLSGTITLIYVYVDVYSRLIACSLLLTNKCLLFCWQYTVTGWCCSITNTELPEDVPNWCGARRLQLNPVKANIMWFSSSTLLQRLSSSTTSVVIDQQTTTTVDKVRNLGVDFGVLILQRRRKRLHQIRRLLGCDVVCTLVSAFVLSWIDYCNAVLPGLLQSTIAPLQWVLNAAACVVCVFVNETMSLMHWSGSTGYQLRNV